MKISIITSCYNAEEYLRETIDSVVFQKGNFELEYILIDNNSTDNTGEIINSYRDRHKENQLNIRCRSLEIKYLRESDSGLYDALAKGFRLSTGEIMGYINANDIIFPNALSTVQEVFTEHRQINWITGVPVVLNNAGQPVYWIMPFKYNRKLTRQGFNLPGRLYFIQQESTFWRKELLNTVPPEQFRQYKYAGDYFLWHCFSAKADLYQLRSFLGASRKHPNRLSDQHRKYREEVDSFAEPKTLASWFKAKLYFCMTVGMVDKIKMLFNKRILSYKKGKWGR